MIRRLYDWTLSLAGHPRAPWALAATSFAESSFFPIPPDVLLIPMVLAKRHLWFWYASLCTAASVAGGVLGYAIGYYLIDTLGLWIINIYGLREEADAMSALYNTWGTWVILIKGLTPIPYKLVTIASGMAKFSFFAFVAASVVSRAMRFYLVAGLIYWVGEPVREFVERRLTLVTTIAAVLLVGGFVSIKYLLP